MVGLKDVTAINYEIKKGINKFVNTFFSSVTIIIFSLSSQ